MVAAVAAVALQVTIIESVLTLVQFGLLIIIAWAVDVKFWTKGRRGGKSAATVAPDAVVVSVVWSIILCITCRLMLTTPLLSLSCFCLCVQQAIDSAVILEAGMGGAKLDVDQFDNPMTDTDDKDDTQPKQHPPLLVAWRQQFAEAIEYDSKAAEDGEEAGGVAGLIMHFLSIFWKLLLATVPPAWWLGGWPCFFTSLLWIVAQVSGAPMGCASSVQDEVAAGLLCHMLDKHPGFC